MRRGAGVGAGAGLLVAALIGAVVWNLVDASDPARALVDQPTVYTASAVSATPRTSASPESPGEKPMVAAAPEVSQAWLKSTAAKTGIPATALRAYARAELGAACHPGWTTLAGIGWVESQHGTIGGRTLAADGYSSSPIVGPALGSLDHAYGPMQFIPSTWARYAVDGDGDGRADVNDLNDAALAAADYLCATGQGLATGAGWSAAVYSYNHSQAYVDQVYAAASAYDERTR